VSDNSGHEKLREHAGFRGVPVCDPNSAAPDSRLGSATNDAATIARSYFSDLSAVSRSISYERSSVIDYDVNSADNTYACWSLEVRFGD
jgi:hypothetical protein